MLMMFPAVRQAIQQGSSTALKDICAPYTTIADCSARIVNLYEGILFLFREIWRPVAYSNSE